RKAGSSAVASAAYRSASRMRDERLGRVHDFSKKRGVVHSEVLLPDGAPEVWSDRERLWNDVEAFEVRKDAQLAREVEFAIPREMNEAQGIALARDFVQSEFVDQGMIADLNVHWDIGEDRMPKPQQPGGLTSHAVAIIALEAIVVFPVGGRSIIQFIGMGLRHRGDEHGGNNCQLCEIHWSVLQCLTIINVMEIRLAGMSPP